MTALGYSAINAKVHFWMSFLMKEEKKEELLNAGYNDILDFIRQNESKTHIESDEALDVESQLKQVLVEYVLSGKRFVSGTSRDFLYEWLRSYEIENLKLIVRSLLSNRPVNFLYQTGRNSRVEMTLETVRNFTSLDDFMEFLRPSEYYELARETFPRVKEEVNTFFWEMMLDNFFVYRLKKVIKGMDKASLKAVQELMFFSLEMNRLMWLYRLRFTYAYSLEECLSYIPNITKIISQNRYLRLLDAENPEQFTELLVQWKILKEKPATLQDLQKGLNAAIQSRARRYMRGSPFSFGIMLAFVLLKSQNVRWLIMLLEGKRAGINANTLGEMLV